VGRQAFFVSVSRPAAGTRKERVIQVGRVGNHTDDRKWGAICMVIANCRPIIIIMIVIPSSESVVVRRFMLIYCQERPENRISQHLHHEIINKPANPACGITQFMNKFVRYTVRGWQPHPSNLTRVYTSVGPINVYLFGIVYNGSCE
jgi:hypothetical protein